MNPQTLTVVGAPKLHCSGTTRSQALCRGHVRYVCACGSGWCGTHVLRSASGLSCPACARPVEAA